MTKPNTCEVVTDDILEEEIFLRLPVKSLLRFKSISTQWRSMIESKYLAKKRLLVRFPNPRLLVLRSKISTDRRSRTLFLETISKDDHHDDDHINTFIHSSKFSDPLPQYFVHYLGRIVGYCNGLVCIYDHGNIYIVNPTTRNLQILSPHFLTAYSSRPGWSGELPIDVGFGRDIVTGRYKLILIYLFDYLAKAEVFDLTNNVRRYIYFPIFANQLMEDKPSIFANGSLFWLTKRDSISTDKLTKLAAIDLHTEKFRDVLLPSWYAGYSASVYLWSLKDRLCLSDVLQYPNVDVWSLEQEDPSVKWEKIFSINIASMDCLDSSFWKLGLAACYFRPIGEKPSKGHLEQVPEDHCSTVLITENLISSV